jgi:MoaA/NifB/PqqE/SkfB family radical SAM enzyme
MNARVPDLHFDNKNMLWLEITNFCNLNCSHCYNSSGSSEPLIPDVSVHRYHEILDEAKSIGFRRVQFIGGEPLFYPYLKELLDHAMHSGFEFIEIFSNLTAVPLWFLEPMYRNVRVATSVYSDDSLVHDAITESKGSFRRTIRSVKHLVSLGTNLRAGFIEMERNRGHFSRTRDYLKSLGVCDVGLDGVREFGRADHQGEKNISELCGQCSRGNLSVDVKGNVSACIMSKQWIFGNVAETGLQDLFSSSTREQFTRDLEAEIERRITNVPVLCSPYDQGQCAPQCAPSCYPSQNCNPCSPLASNPCNPNGRCGPY